jgi:hypothetical protein
MPTLTIRAQGNHNDQWIALKKLMVERRGSTRGRDGFALPMLTNGDALQLVQWWHQQYRRVPEPSWYELQRQSEHGSRKRWQAFHDAVKAALQDAEPSAPYAAGQQLWDETSRLSLYLDSRKIVPSATTLLMDSFSETAGEYAEAARDAADAVTRPARETAKSVLKTAGAVAGGVVGVAAVYGLATRPRRQSRQRVRGVWCDQPEI